MPPSLDGDRCRKSLGTIRGPSAARAAAAAPPRQARVLPNAFQEASPRHVRPARHPRSARPGAVAASRRQLLRSGVVRARARAPVARSPRYIGHSLAVPEVGDFHALPQEREGRALLRTRDGLPAGLERLPSPPGGDAARAAATPARTSSARCIAGPTPRRAADRRAPFPVEPCLDLDNSTVQTWNGMVFDMSARRAPPRRRRRSRRHRPRGRPRLHRLRVRPCQAERIRLQLEDLHRGLPRGLSRRAVSSRPGRIRHLRRPALGVRPAYSVQTGAPKNELANPARPPIASGTTPSSPTARAASTIRCRATARSG